ncbi:hypothetical protein [uncultured Senegalimassilia sp.]|uniref:hypothetical protein n=1 Tax=uncultured Senegalimassilia sp. TaxID=1714350 RepID=UPI0025E61BB8|nr:hypothetical protein [uncultured Senegalimassilia sp.]
MGLLQIFFAVIFGAVSLLVAFQLMNGKYLQLVYKYDESANHQKQQQEAKAKEIAKLASAVTFAFFATDASLLFYELGRTMGVSDLATIFSLVCDVAMVAFLITVVRLYVKLVGSKDPKAKFKSSNVRVTVFVLVQCVLLSLMAVVF